MIKFDKIFNLLKCQEFSIQSINGSKKCCRGIQKIPEHAQEPPESQTHSNIPPVCDWRFLTKESANWQHPFVSEWSTIVRDPFTTLISCILSLRTKDEVTAKASVRLLGEYNTPEKILKLSTRKIEELIYPVGFYKTKAERIKEISRTLIKDYDSKVPLEFDELLKLKGVGRKTANIVMVFGHKSKEHIPIDTHCHRIPNRLGWIKTKTPEQTEFALKKILPKQFWHDFNELFVRFGQNVCVPVSPFCSRCSIEKYCDKVGVTRSR